MPEVDLDSLYWRYRPGLVRAAERLLRDRAAAEDAVQETWLRAIESYGGAASGGALPPGAWLYRVCLNLCYDRLRSAKRSRTAPVAPGQIEAAGVPVGTAAAASAGVGGDPEAAALEAEAAEAVRTAIEVLPAALREVVVLREYGDLKYREIAEATGCPVGTVMSRLHLARQRLKRELAPYLELDPGVPGRKTARTAAARPDGQESDEHAAGE